MTVNIPDRFLPQIMRALDNYAAYLNATNRDPRPFEEIIQRLQNKPSKVTMMPGVQAATPKSSAVKLRGPNFVGKGPKIAGSK